MHVHSGLLVAGQGADMTYSTSDIIIGETSVERHMLNGRWLTERNWMFLPPARLLKVFLLPYSDRFQVK